MRGALKHNDVDVFRKSNVHDSISVIVDNHVDVPLLLRDHRYVYALRG
jgi:hypothetical protein